VISGTSKVMVGAPLNVYLEEYAKVKTSHDIG
jgi:hypothetical protein